jgi:hypothetical protein
VTTVQSNKPITQDEAKMPTLIHALMKAYGPHSYGLVTILVLWFTIGQPGLESQRKISETQAQAAQAFKDATANLSRESEALLGLAVQMNKAMDRTERMLQRLETVR